MPQPHRSCCVMLRAACTGDPCVAMSYIGSRALYEAELHRRDQLSSLSMKSQILLQISLRSCKADGSPGMRTCVLHAHDLAESLTAMERAFVGQCRVSDMHPALLPESVLAIGQLCTIAVKLQVYTSMHDARRLYDLQIRSDHITSLPATPG